MATLDINWLGHDRGGHHGDRPSRRFPALVTALRAVSVGTRMYDLHRRLARHACCRPVLQIRVPPIPPFECQLILPDTASIDCRFLLGLLLPDIIHVLPFNRPVGLDRELLDLR